jgi:hypothetical protein
LETFAERASSKWLYIIKEIISSLSDIPGKNQNLIVISLVYTTFSRKFLSLHIQIVQLMAEAFKVGIDGSQRVITTII